MELSRLAVGLILISVLSFARAQVNCPAFNVSELGATDMRTPSGLVVSALEAVSGDPSNPTSVQVHGSNIVCLRSGRTRDTYSGVSVVVNYTCTGAPTECTGNPILSQFDFECVAGTPTYPGVRWAASVDSSASNIITTPPDASLSTTLRTDCGVCLSPARSIFATITNNEQHCGSCNSACNVGLMRCFNRLDSGCCNFFVNDTCVGNCTSPQVPNNNFDCVTMPPPTTPPPTSPPTAPPPTTSPPIGPSAPGDENSRCVNQLGPYPPSVRMMLMDSRNYEQLITGSSAVWQSQDVDGTGSGWASSFGGLCAAQPRSCDFREDTPQDNWFFTQYIRYTDATQDSVFVNITANFQECRLNPSCTQLYVDMYRYERNGVDATAARNTNNYQFERRIEQPSDFSGQQYPDSFSFTSNDTNRSYLGFYLGFRANDTCVNILRLQVYYSTLPVVTTPSPTTPPPTTPPPTTPPPTTPPPTTPPPTTPPPTTPPPTTPPPTTPPPTTPPPTTPPPTTPPPTTPPPTTPPPTTPPPTTPPPTTPPPTTPPPTTSPPTGPSAPGDEDSRCVNQLGPYPPSVRMMLMDSRNYEQLITGSSAVWQSLDVDGTGDGWTSSFGGLCAAQPRSCDFREDTLQDNWLFTQYIRYTDATQDSVFVNITANFQECRLNPSCTQLYIDMYRYERNGVDATAARNTTNYQFEQRIEQPSDFSGQQYADSFSFTSNDTNRSYLGFYLGFRANDTCVNIQRLQVYYSTLPVAPTTPPPTTPPPTTPPPTTPPPTTPPPTTPPPTTPPPTTPPPTTPPPTTPPPTTPPPTTPPPTTPPPTTPPPTTPPPTTPPPTTPPPTTPPPTTPPPTTPPPTTPPPTVPPPSMLFVNGSPVVEGNTVSVNVMATVPGASFMCELLRKDRPTIIEDCSNGSTAFADLPWGVYRVRIVTTAPNATRSVFRRRVVIPRDPNYCTVNLINDGAVVRGNTLTVHFRGVGPVTGFQCILDRRTRSRCTSPVSVTDLSRGLHRYKVIPQGCDRGSFTALPFRFTIQ